MIFQVPAKTSQNGVNHSIRMLIVEDEESYREPLAYRFRREGYEVLTAASGDQGLDIFLNNTIDIAILDVMLPGLDGLSLCKAIRKQSHIPIIVVSAKGSELDKVLGLELGADDYVTKPYSFRELLARVHAVLRRHGFSTNAETTSETSLTFHEQTGVKPLLSNDSSDSQIVLEYGNIRLDTARHIVAVCGQEVPFPLKEFELLEYLMRHKGLVVTRAKLIERIWGTDYVGDTKTLDVHIKRIRAKIELNPSRPQYITTVRGLGYRFDLPQSQE